MALERDLAIGVLERHPLAAARVLEGLAAAEAAAFVATATPAAAAACLRSMHLPAVAAVLGALELPRAAEILGMLPTDLAARCLRRLDPDRQEALLDAVDARHARSLRTLLLFEPNTAGALMDPDVLALPEDLTVREATNRVREAAGEARYNVYVLDGERRLVGVLNLRELLLAPPRALLSSIALRDPHRLSARADRHAILSHPGWREVHALPVVDAGDVYLGAIRYRTLRRLEDQLRGTGSEADTTARALGDLLRTGATSVLEAVTASVGGVALAEGSRDGS